MKAIRPTIDQAQLDSFIRQGVHSSAPPSECATNVSNTANSEQWDTDGEFIGVAYKSAMKDYHKVIAKFLLEMPPSLRKSIKYRSIQDGRSMNELIVACLLERFGA